MAYKMKIPPIVVVPPHALLTFKGQHGVTVNWVLEAADELRREAEGEVIENMNETAPDPIPPGLGWDFTDRTLVKYGKIAFRLIGKQRQLLKFLVESEGNQASITEVSACVWESNEDEQDAIDGAIRPMNRLFKKRGIPYRLRCRLGKVMIDVSEVE